MEEAAAAVTTVKGDVEVDEWLCRADPTIFPRRMIARGERNHLSFCDSSLSNNREDRNTCSDVVGDAFLLSSSSSSCDYRDDDRSRTCV